MVNQRRLALAITAGLMLFAAQAQAAPRASPHGHGHEHGEGPRGKPPVARPPIHPHPPPPVIVVPPCKRGGHGITPC
jgi:hypothetical protein